MVQLLCERATRRLNRLEKIITMATMSAEMVRVVRLPPPEQLPEKYFSSAPPRITSTKQQIDPKFLYIPPHRRSVRPDWAGQEEQIARLPRAKPPLLFVHNLGCQDLRGALSTLEHRGGVWAKQRHF